MEKLVSAGAPQALAFAASYIAVLVLMGVALTFRVVARRRAAQVGIGDGGDRELMRRIRIHGNFAETAPVLMLLLLALALVGAREWQVHLVGLAGIVGRSLHAIGLTVSPGVSWQRLAGMAMTITAMIAGAAMLLVAAWA